MLRQLFLSTDPSAQPFAVSGSGTLGWDFVAANLVERGEDVLVLHTGMFSIIKQPNMLFRDYLISSEHE